MRYESNGGAALASHSAPLPETETAYAPQITSLHSLPDVVEALRAHGALLLAENVYQFVHLVKIQEGRLEFRPHESAPPTLSSDLGKALQTATGKRWVVSISQAVGEPTMAEVAERTRQAEIDAILQMPVIRNIIEIFPDARLTDVKNSKH